MRPFQYRAPVSIDAALSAVEPMGQGGQGGAFIAGGTTVLDLMKLAVLTPNSLTDIRHLGLDEIQEDGATATIGARVTMATAAEHPLFKTKAPVLGDALWKAASPQLRNVATLGGNVLQRTRCGYFRDTASPCNKREPGSGCSAIEGVNRGLAVLGTSANCIANYPGDWANALILFDATVETKSANGSREIAMEELHVLPGDDPSKETVLGDDELITAYRITVPAWANRSLYVKARDRESYAFALASAAVALDMDGSGAPVREARVALGGVATVPWRARKVEDYLKGRTIDETIAMTAGGIAMEGAKGSGDNDFKLQLGQRVVAKALLQAAAMDLASKPNGNG